MLKKPPSFLLMLDYDGTLAEIAPTPARAKLPKTRQLLLKKLATHPAIQVVIVTGRALQDIRHKIKLKSVIYVACHGYEIYAHGKYLYPRGRKICAEMKKLGKLMTKSCSGIPGVIVEEKSFSVAVHYRLTPKKYWPQLEKLLRKTSLPWRKKYSWQITSGKMLLEIRPEKKWNKGKAALFVQEHFAPQSRSTWYFGDDVTDESAFRALKKTSLTFAVARESTAAKYKLKNVTKVWQILKALLNLAPHQNKSPA